MRIYKSTLLLLVITVFSCGGAKEDKATEQTEVPSYKQTMALIFADSTDVQEWHNSPIEQEAVSVMSLSEGAENDDCGNKVMLTNNGDQAAMVTVSTVFPFTEGPWEVSQTYEVEPGASVHAGNNRVCWNGKETPFRFKIEGAFFK